MNKEKLSDYRETFEENIQLLSKKEMAELLVSFATTDLETFGAEERLDNLIAYYGWVGLSISKKIQEKLAEQDRA
jgi:hypothetical protein